MSRVSLPVRILSWQGADSARGVRLSCTAFGLSGTAQAGQRCKREPLPRAAFIKRQPCRPQAWSADRAGVRCKACRHSPAAGPQLAWPKPCTAGSSARVGPDSCLLSSPGQVVLCWGSECACLGAGRLMHSSWPPCTKCRCRARTPHDKRALLCVIHTCARLGGAGRRSVRC